MVTAWRRRTVIAAGGVLLAPRIVAQSVPHPGAQSTDAMPTPEQMQEAQRGGLYANLRDPHVTELPPDAFAQRFAYSPAPKAEPQGTCPTQHRCRFRAARWPGRSPRAAACT
ncbi:MAG: hypothetical protein JO326_13885 [Acetobacteraceae bacterium]|nr:hypothetical protein [Acetobacteraceae bacterium]